ncbi:glycoside hydrolase family 71 protein [Streptomyces sp. NPDC090127]|uniref:glycoside hydrolase family 71 protein n=1 Tax=Streptomyces sp. NPDC090127 TaxID=3365953 RepID=UPI0038124538
MADRSSDRTHRAPGRHRAAPGLALAVLLLGAWAGIGTAGALRAGGPADAGSAPPEAYSTALPFDLPPPAELRRSPKLVFAHYFTPYPLSLDNEPADRDYYTRNYLTPDGEKGKHSAYGGLLRDRPLPAAPETGDWELAHLRQEIRTARDAGLDGFTLDLLSESGRHRDRAELLLAAAHEEDPGFRIQLMPDMTALTDATPVSLADHLAELARHPSAHRLADGRLVVSPFKAEEKDPDWWRAMMRELESRHGIRTALVPLFLDFTPDRESYAAISHGLSAWGARSPDRQSGAAADAERAHQLGRIWMHPVSVQDARPNQGVYDEAGNTETLRASWNAAISSGADWVQLTTWNDYSEGTHLAPSAHNGHAYLDLSSYYLTRFKTGAWPTILRDTLYLTARVQFVDDLPPTTRQPQVIRPRPGTATPRDAVEVLSFLTAPADVRTRTGTTASGHRAPAGVHAHLLPLRTGHSSATVVRSGTTTTTVRSRFPVQRPIDRQDLQYYAVTSGRAQR